MLIQCIEKENVPFGTILATLSGENYGPESDRAEESA